MNLYIIGGGASVTPEIIEILKEEQKKGNKLFGINHACANLDLDYLVYLDDELYLTHKEKIDLMQCKVFTRCKSRPSRAILIKKAKTFKYLEPIDAVFAGKNTVLSGIAGISIALNLGYKNIRLVGYDGGDFFGKTHSFHKKARHDRYNRFCNEFDIFKNYGIINCNEHSHINSFVKKELRQLIDEDNSNINMQKKQSIKFHSYYGFGDQIQMRKFIIEATKKYEDVYVVTPYPDILYFDTKVKCLAPETRLKNQKEYTEKSKQYYVDELPKYDRNFRFDYCSLIRQRKQAIYYSLNEQFPICSTKDLEKQDFSFPIKNDWVLSAKQKIKDLNVENKKICVLKLPTLRTEWQNKSRNPLMKYFQQAINIIKKDFFIISVADLRNNLEWLTEDLPQGIDYVAHNAEFDLKELIGLLSFADLTITCPSNFVHICSTNNYPCFTIFGGSAPNYIYIDPLKPSKYGYIEPEDFCFCFSNEHICNKEIDEQRFEEEFMSFVLSIHPELNLRTQKRVLLLSRIESKEAKDIIKTTKEKFDCIGISHLPIEYYSGCKFKEVYQFKNSDFKTCETMIKELIDKHKISHAFINQKGNIQAEATFSACQQKHVRSAWSERFFDDRMILDFTALQYFPENDISLYAPKHKKNKINYLNSQREPQPQDITPEEVYNKYGVDKEQTLVYLAQLPYDEAVKQSACPLIGGYDDFIRTLIERNPNIKILLKYHPKETEHNRHIRYEQKYSNVIVCNESLQSLFNAFEYFASFSSTSIFEGVLQKKRFVTGGYHLCSDDRLVLQIKRPEHLGKIINRINTRFKIDLDYWQKHMSFITTKYTVSIKKKEIIEKLMKRTYFYE